jgi:hypothetical protein
LHAETKNGWPARIHEPPARFRPARGACVIPAEPART